MADKEPIPTPPAQSDSADAAEKPRPIVRRPHPIYKPATESLSLQPIGGGPAHLPGAPIGASAAPAAPEAPSVPSAPPAPTAPSTMGGLGALNASSAPTAAAASGAAPEAAAPAPRMGGLAAVGQSGPAILSAAPAPSAAPPAVAPPPSAPPPSSTPIPYPGSANPVMDRRPVSVVKADSSADTGFASSAIKIGVGILAAVLVFFVVRAILPSKIPVPSKLTPYNSSSGVFALDAPEGWSRKGADTKREDSLTGEQSDADTDGVTISYGKAVIEVYTDSGGKAVQNQLLSGGGPNFAALLDDKHKEFIGSLKKRIGNYQDTDAGSFNIGPFGAKIADYTGTTGFLFFGGKVHGLAATVHGPKHFMMIYLQCPENNWESLKPVYERVLQSAALDGVSAKTIQERLGGLGGAAGGVPPGAGGIQIPGGGSVSIPPGVGGF